MLTIRKIKLSLFIFAIAAAANFLPVFFHTENFAIKKAHAAIETLRPTTHTDSALVTTNPADAYDTLGSTFSTTDYGNNVDPSITFHTWQTTSQIYTNTYLKVRYHADAGTDDKYAISYSTFGCSGAFTDLVPLTSSGSADTTVSSADLGASPNLSQFCVKIYSLKSKGADRANVYLRDIWTEGAYAPSSSLTVGTTNSTTGGQYANLDSGSNNIWLGGAFTFSIGSGSANVTGIKISNIGNAGNLSDIRIFYETTNNGYSGTESCFNTSCADGGGGTLGSNIPGSITLNSGNTYYLYIIADISNTVAGGLTIDLQINNPSIDIITGAVNTDTNPKNIGGNNTTIIPNITSVTYPVLPDGGRIGDTISISGAGFGTTCNIVAGNKITIQTYDLPCTGAVFNNNSISIPVDSGITVYGGAGVDGLLVTIGGVSDNSRFDFYVYPNITSISSNNAQIGSTITISGDHFGPATGNVAINTKSAAIVGSWNETNLTVRIPGQEGAVNINGKIQITRSLDSKTSNLFPSDPSNFTILAPSVSGSNPSYAQTGQILQIEFSGSGIDTDAGTAPILKLTKSGETDIIGTSYMKITDYQTVSASFDLGGAITGYWKLTIINMDTQSGSYGDETSMGFNVTSSSPVVTGINPFFGLNSGIKNITSVTGSNFQNGALVKLTKSGQSDINASTAFSFSDSNTLLNGSFDLTGKILGWWNVVVINPDLQTGSYGNEIDTGFEIRSGKPLPANNTYQFKNNTDSSQPPTTNIIAGEGVGGQTTIYFRMDMEGGLSGENYYPQVELKPTGVSFECDNASPTPCTVTSGFFSEGAGIIYNGTAVHGWVNIDGLDGSSYHWQTRIRNSSGTGDWTSFGGNPENEIDVYIDNTPPLISMGTDGSCATAPANISDLAVTIQWDTSDLTSGSQPPPGAGAYATAQIEYIKTANFTDWISTPGLLSDLKPRENSPHQVLISGLIPSTGYTYRAISKDYVGNESFSSDCSFITTSTRPIKTIQQFITQETAKNTGSQIIKNFSITIPESPSAEIIVKSAMIEITGVSSSTPALSPQIINVGLLRGNQITPPVGADYSIDSEGTTTSFTILFDALNPPGTGQENVSDITTGGSIYEYTLFLKGTAVPTSVLGAKLILTYRYTM